MRIGFTLPQFGELAHHPQHAARFARQAEALGADSLWVGDRLLAPVDPKVGYAGTDVIPPEFRSALDPFALLATAAAVTERVQLGTNVINAPWYRARAARPLPHQRRSAERGTAAGRPRHRLVARGVRDDGHPHGRARPPPRRMPGRPHRLVDTEPGRAPRRTLDRARQPHRPQARRPPRPPVYLGAVPPPPSPGPPGAPTAGCPSRPSAGSTPGPTPSPPSPGTWPDCGKRSSGRDGIRPASTRSSGSTPMPTPRSRTSRPRSRGRSGRRA